MDLISLEVISLIIGGVVVPALWLRRPNRTAKTSLVGKIIGGSILLFIGLIVLLFCGFSIYFRVRFEFALSSQSFSDGLLLFLFLVVFRPFGGILDNKNRPIKTRLTPPYLLPPFPLYSPHVI